MLSNVWILKSGLFKNIQTYILVCRACGGNWSCKYDLYFRFPPPNYRLMTVTNRLTADCWLWLTKQANTFYRFSWSLRKTLKWPVTTAISLTTLLILYILHLLHVLFVTDINVLSFFLAADYHFVPLGMLSEEFEIWVITFKGKGF